MIRRFAVSLKIILAAGLLMAGCSCQDRAGCANRGIPVYGYKVANTYRHDASFYTEGLAIDGGYLYESTGISGRSKIVKTRLRAGEIVKELPLAKEYFGEGITVTGANLYQLTYKSNTGFVYDKDSLEEKAQFNYPGDGWGLASDGRNLLMSNGTAEIVILDIESLKEVKRIKAHDDNGGISSLNELEHVEGKIYANILNSKRIAVILADSGKLCAWVDISGLNPHQAAFPNGIAYDKKTGHFFVTGKYWDKIYEIELVIP